MKKFDSDDSSDDEGQLSNSDDEGGNKPPQVKPSKRKIWSNVVLDQAVDDIGNVNTFSGNSGSRNVESYGTYARKRKRSESMNSDNESIDDKDGDAKEGMEEESEFDSLLRNASGAGGGGAKRRKIVYDVSNHCSEDEELLDSVDSLDNIRKTEDSKKAKSELDFTLGDAIMESSRFLNRVVDYRNKRPQKTCPPEEALSYLTWALNESNVELLQRLLKLKSVAFVFAALDETIRTEREGGIMTNSGIRRRLPGGVFIAQLKKRLTEFEKFIVLDGKSEVEANRELEKRKKRKKASQLRREKKKKARQRKGLLTPSNVVVQDLNDLIVENVNATYKHSDDETNENRNNELVDSSIANEKADVAVVTKAEAADAQLMESFEDKPGSETNSK